MTGDQPTTLSVSFVQETTRGRTPLNPTFLQQRAESPVLGQDLHCFAFTAGQFELHLVYPVSVELPDSVTRLLKGICRQIDVLATAEQGRK